VGSALALLLTAALPLSPAGDEAPFSAFPREALVGGIEERSGDLAPRPRRVLSKKEAWLREKAWRPDVHVSDADLARSLRPRSGARRVPAQDPLAVSPPPVGSRVEPLTTLFNLRTREALPILPGLSIEERFHPFLRDHFTNQATRMDERLINVLSRVAVRFSARRIEVVSGYRSPKYNLILRKKGREVARTSQHVQGNAVDFRVRGVRTDQLLHFVRSLRIGGVGFYPHSQFVHSDTGRIRFWKGT
jgi:hypothetical protein